MFIFNTLLIDVLERWKLSPPPDLKYPDIVEWSKSLPPEKWTTRSAELEIALASHAGSQSINEWPATQERATVTRCY